LGYMTVVVVFYETRLTCIEGKTFQHQSIKNATDFPKVKAS